VRGVSDAQQDNSADSVPVATVHSTTACAHRAGWLTRISPTEWLCLAVGLVLVIQYAWFLDDAFVYFRYVDNLLYLGYGLVFNAGEYVEGYSSPAWALLLIGLRAIGLDYWLLTRLVGAGAFVLFVFLAKRVNELLSPREGRRVNLPLCFLALNYGVLCYFTSGLESPLVHVSAGVYAIFACRPECWMLQAAIGVTPLVRQELLVPMMLALAWSWWRTRRVPWTLVVSAVVACGGWLAFRVYYYADLLPNTFYLKDTADFAQGLAYVWDTVGPYHVWALLLGLAAILAVMSRGERGADRGASRSCMMLQQRLAMLGFALPVLVYVVRIGGDPRHFRYLAFPFDLALFACGGIVEWLWQRMHWRAVWMYVTGAAAMVASLTAYPVELSAHPLFGGPPRVAHREVYKIKDAWVHRHDPTLAQPAWGRSRELEQREAYAEFRAEHPNGIYLGVGEGTWCVTLYKAFNYRVVQSFGLTDAVLAHIDAPAERPGHKHQLIPRARELVQLLDQYGEPGVGMYRKMVEAGAAPAWVGANLPALEMIERKIYNGHRFVENLKLALQFAPRVRVTQGEGAR
jgi:hypothetical protein